MRLFKKVGVSSIICEDKHHQKSNQVMEMEVQSGRKKELHPEAVSGNQ
jgi:hypothetical protein